MHVFEGCPFTSFQTYHLSHVITRPSALPKYLIIFVLLYQRIHTLIDIIISEM